MLPQIPELTMTGLIPLGTPLGALLVLALLATLALALVTEPGVGTTLRSLLPGGPRVKDAGRGIATAAPRS